MIDTTFEIIFQSNISDDFGVHCANMTVRHRWDQRIRDCSSGTWIQVFGESIGEIAWTG